ncbi:MAG: choice-of-anchor Q domain-containing protein [Chloroflexota bacterium]
MKNLLPSHIVHPEKLFCPPDSIPPELGERYRAEMQRLQRLPRRQQRALRKKWRMGLAGIALVLALGSSLATVQLARAAEIYVDGTSCTLAEAIVTANNGSLQAGCAQGDNGGDDTIYLQSNIVLTTPVSAVTNGSLTIEGSGYTIQRDPGSTISFTVLSVGSTGNLTLNRATIVGGLEPGNGGGISNLGTLSLNSCTISGNEAGSGGGIANTGSLHIQGSTIASNNARYDGGGIYSNGGSIEIYDTTISGNVAGERGGGMFVDTSDTQVYGSAIISNTATDNGGGVFFLGQSNALIGNSTISGNTSNNGGGVYNQQNSLTLRSATVSGNTGGGIYNYDSTNSVASLRSSIVAFQASGDNCYAPMDSVIFSNGYNIESGATCNLTNTGDQQNVTVDALDLGPLQDNGGRTLTHALLVSDSVAVDQIPLGFTGCLTTTLSSDQRGAVRADGPGRGGALCDTGAFEYDSYETPSILTGSVFSTRAAPSGNPLIALGGLLTAALGSALAFWRKRKDNHPT